MPPSPNRRSNPQNPLKSRRSRKRRSFGAILIAFGLGVMFAVPPFLGVLALLMGGMIAVCAALEAPGSGPPRPIASRSPAGVFDSDPEAEARAERRAFELRERVLRDVFSRVRPREAAALAGFLHSHTIELRPSLFGGRTTLPALEFHVAMQWVGETFGWESERLRQIYVIDWVELRDEFCPEITRQLEAHPQVISIDPFEDLV